MKKKTLPELSCTIPRLAPDIDKLAEGNKLIADRIRTLLHNIYVTWVFNSRIDSMKNNDFHPEGWITLSSKKLQSLLTQDYEKMVRLCEKLKLIEVKRTANGNKSYVTTHRATPYRINPILLPKVKRQYREEQITEYKVIKAIQSHIAKKRADRDPQRGIKPFPKLESMLGDFRFDTELLDTFIECIGAGKIKLDRETTKGIITSSYMAKSINQGEYYATVDDFGRRLHTSYTQIPREFRNYLRIRTSDERLCMVDICNSQPFFIALAFNFPEKLIPILPELKPVFIFLANERKGDKRLFFEYTIRGTIYENWQVYRGLESRDNAKAEMIESILFSNPKYNKKKHQNARQHFKLHFPDMWSGLLGIKDIDETKLPFITELYVNKYGGFAGKKSLHKNASLLCQRLESEILLGHVAEKLADNPLMDSFLTIHDSFLVKESNRPIVEQTIHECFQALELPSPKTKVTRYGQ